MTGLRRRLVICLTCAAVAGLIYPYGELAWKCRLHSAHSEGCVWARAYFPLSRWVEPAIVAPIAFLVMFLLVVVADKRR
jgi:hypothetical protein